MYEVGTFIRAAAQTVQANIVLSNQLLLRDDRDHRMVSRPGELPFANYMKIDNTHLSAAAQIKARFDL